MVKMGVSRWHVDKEAIDLIEIIQCSIHVTPTQSLTVTSTLTTMTGCLKYRSIIYVYKIYVTRCCDGLSGFTGRNREHINNLYVRENKNCELNVLTTHEEN